MEIALFGDRFANIAVAWMATYWLHSTMLLAFAWIAAGFLGRRRLPAQERVWRMALVGGLVTATLQLGLGWSSPLSLPVPGTAVAQPAAADRIVVIEPAATGGSKPVTSLAARVDPGKASPSARPATLIPLRPTAEAQSIHWPLALTALWLLGALALSARLALSYFVLGRRLRDRRELDRGALYRLFRRLADSLTRPHNVRLTACGRLDVPIARGLRRAEVCLPERARHELGLDQQEIVLAHELAHVERRDPAWLLFYRLVESILFLQPLNLVATRALREIAEYSCDDRAVAQTGRPVTLARCLTLVAGWNGASRSPLPVPSMARTRLGERVQRLLERDYPRPQVAAPRWLGGFGLLVLLAFAALAPGLSPASGSEPVAPEIAAAPSPPAPPDVVEPVPPDAIEPVPSAPTRPVTAPAPPAPPSAPVRGALGVPTAPSTPVAPAAPPSAPRPALAAIAPAAVPSAPALSAPAPPTAFVAPSVRPLPAAAPKPAVAVAASPSVVPVPTAGSAAMAPVVVATPPGMPRATAPVPPAESRRQKPADDAEETEELEAVMEDLEEEIEDLAEVLEDELDEEVDRVEDELDEAWDEVDEELESFEEEGEALEDEVEEDLELFEMEMDDEFDAFDDDLDRLEDRMESRLERAGGESSSEAFEMGLERIEERFESLSEAFEIDVEQVERQVERSVMERYGHDLQRQMEAVSEMAALESERVASASERVAELADRISAAHALGEDELDRLRNHALESARLARELERAERSGGEAVRGLEEERRLLLAEREELRGEQAARHRLTEEERSHLREEARRIAEEARPSREQMDRLRAEAKRMMEASRPSREELAALRAEVRSQLDEIRARYLAELAARRAELKELERRY